MKIIIDSQKINQPSENIKIDLQNVIDNRGDEYVILPKEISYFAGYFNISAALSNNSFRYSNGKIIKNLVLLDGLYTLQQYFNAIKTTITSNSDNGAHINYNYIEYNGTVRINVVAPYTFYILEHQRNLLGFNKIQTIATNLTSDNPINFSPHKMLYVHLKQLKNNSIYFNGTRSDVLAKCPVTKTEFGTLVNHKFDMSHAVELDNTSINCLELTITDESNNIINFHNMPIFYIFEIRKKE